jgi:hypothetical protein
MSKALATQDYTTEEMPIETNITLQIETAMIQQLQALSNPKCDMDKEDKKTKALVSVATVLINTQKMKIDAVRTKNAIMARQQKQLKNPTDKK